MVTADMLNAELERVSQKPYLDNMLNSLSDEIEKNVDILHKDYLYVQKQGHLIAAINIHSGDIDWEWKAPAGFLQNR